MPWCAFLALPPRDRCCPFLSVPRRHLEQDALLLLIVAFLQRQLQSGRKTGSIEMHLHTGRRQLQKSDRTGPRADVTEESNKEEAECGPKRRGSRRMTVYSVQCGSQAAPLPRQRPEQKAAAQAPACDRSVEHGSNHYKRDSVGERLPRGPLRCISTREGGSSSSTPQPFSHKHTLSYKLFRSKHRTNQDHVGDFGFCRPHHIMGGGTLQDVNDFWMLVLCIGGKYIVQLQVSEESCTFRILAIIAAYSPM